MSGITPNHTVKIHLPGALTVLQDCGGDPLLCKFFLFMHPFNYFTFRGQQKPGRGSEGSQTQTYFSKLPGWLWRASEVECLWCTRSSSLYVPPYFYYFPSHSLCSSQCLVLPYLERVRHTYWPVFALVTPSFWNTHPLYILFYHSSLFLSSELPLLNEAYSDHPINTASYLSQHTHFRLMCIAHYLSPC